MQKKHFMKTNTLAYCALLTALSVVLARLFGLMPEESSRFSIEAVPIFIAGMLFGPIAGGMVGFSADFIGCLFSPFGYNPIFCLPPILYGVFAGILRHFMAQKFNPFRLFVSFLLPAVFGSILWQSFALAYVYYYETFWQGLLVKLTSRSVQFAIVTIVDCLLIYLLFQANIFAKLGLWPPMKKRKDTKENDC